MVSLIGSKLHKILEILKVCIDVGEKLSCGQVLHYLNVGTGDACAGQLKLIGELNDLCNFDPLISSENFGTDPPIGSSIVFVLFTTSN